MGKADIGSKRLLEEEGEMGRGGDKVRRRINVHHQELEVYQMASKASS